MIKIRKLCLTLASGISLISLSACEGGASPNDSTKPLQVLNNNTQEWSTNNKPENLQDGFFALRMGSGYDTSSNTATSGQSCLVASADQKNIYIAQILKH